MTDIKRAVIILMAHPTTGKILSASRRNDPSLWGVIGGKVDPGETVLEAARREYHEETGVPLAVAPSLTFVDLLEDDGFSTSIFVVTDIADIARAANVFPHEHDTEVEPGIFVGWKTFVTLSEGPFGSFNQRYLFAALARAYGPSMYDDAE